jgi:phenylacetic acid degradation operon negative regulatory protein
MKFKPFHHPDLSLPVIRRRATDEFLESLSLLGRAMATRGRSLTWNHSFPSQRAYWSAVYRLRRAGLVVMKRGRGRTPILVPTEKGAARVADVSRPEQFWKRKWNGYWYILVYDVPERDRSYRAALRGFLARMRMGCLQRSVWVSPDDIRPAYQDLVEAAGVASYAFLFESKTVLGRGHEEVVRTAWPFDKLESIQRKYCEIYEENLGLVMSRGAQPADLSRLAREEMLAYRVAMDEDPLLPAELLPHGYKGKRVYDLHCRLATELGKRL